MSRTQQWVSRQIVHACGRLLLGRVSTGRLWQTCGRPLRDGTWRVTLSIVRCCKFNSRFCEWKYDQMLQAGTGLDQWKNPPLRGSSIRYQSWQGIAHCSPNNFVHLRTENFNYSRQHGKTIVEGFCWNQKARENFPCVTAVYALQTGKFSWCIYRSIS